MSTPLPISFRASPLPDGFKSTPQQFADAFVARLAIETEDDLALFVAGSVAPTTDSGPWIKDNLTWWVWDVGTGMYIPQPLDTLSLRYILTSVTPDHADYDLWIQLDSNGKAQAVKTWYSGAWVDVYSDTFNQIATDITAAGNTSKGYPVVSESVGNQTIVSAGVPNTLEFSSEVLDPDGCFDPVLYRYVAPVTGYYFVTTETQLDNVDCDPADCEFSILVRKNGSPTSIASGNSAASPPGSRWYPSVSGIVQASAGDYLDIQLTNATPTGTVHSSNATINVFRVSDGG